MRHVEIESTQSGQAGGYKKRHDSRRVAEFFSNVPGPEKVSKKGCNGFLLFATGLFEGLDSRLKGICFI
jgi:hypothetical protein